MDCMASDTELVEVLVAGELGVDSGSGSGTIVVVCRLLIAVGCAKDWSSVIVVSTGGLEMGVHSSFGCPFWS